MDIDDLRTRLALNKICCPTPGCPGTRLPGDLMCGFCWRNVPPDLHEQVRRYGASRIARLGRRYRTAAHAALAAARGVEED